MARMSGVLGLWVTHKDQTMIFKFHLRKREKQDYKLTNSQQQTLRSLW
jgi:hypothetical protein